jgi:uncharacterized protein YjbI with pentapeptide repeats
MDAEILKVVGQVAGIGGIALGVLLLVFREVIRKKIFPMLTKEQAYRLLRLVLLLVWLVALAGVVAWVWVATHSKGEPNESAFRALAIYERTSKLRDLLSTGSAVTATASSAGCAPAKWGKISSKEETIQRASAPNTFAVQQVLVLARIDKAAVVEALVPLLSDANVTISSAAVVALARILATVTKDSERNGLVALLPGASALASRGQHLNLKGASLREQDLTPLAGTEVFYGAEMYAADLSGSKVDGITFKAAQLKCAQFVQSSAAKTVFDSANLERAQFWGASAPAATFRLAHLRDTDFSQHEVADEPDGLPFQTSTAYVPANLEDADFGASQMYGTNLSGARIGGARFEGASLSAVNFRGAFLIGMAEGVNEAYVRGRRPAVFDGCIFE